MEIIDLTKVFERVKGKHISITQNGVVLREGVLSDFSAKFINLKFDILNEKTNIVKAFELPYPFDILKENNKTLLFDYRMKCIKSLVIEGNVTEFIEDNNKQPSKLYNSVIKISFSK